MKKLLFAMIAVLTIGCMVLAGCGGSKDSGQGAASGGGEAPSSDGFKFTYNGTTISMDEDMAIVCEALGEPKSYNETTSCAFDGLYKTYYYGSFYVGTYPNGEKDYVNMVWFADDTVATEEGIAKGDSADKLKEVYGEGEETGASGIKYTKGNSTLTFILSGDTVSEITYERIAD